MSYEIKDNKFSHNLVHAFLSRVGFLLNKIKQEHVTQYECEEFTWYIDVADDAHTRSDCRIIIKDSHNEQIIFRWNGAKLADEARIFTNDRRFVNINEGDNLQEFAWLERLVMSHIIKKEKELFAELSYKMVNNVTNK